MEQNIDLPSELSRLFGNTTLRLKHGKLLTILWNDLTNFERKQLMDKLVNNQTSYASIDCYDGYQEQ